MTSTRRNTAKGCLSFLGSVCFAVAIVASVSARSADKKEESSTRPSWVDGGKSKYASPGFLSAVGTGNTREQANEDAKKNLAEVFGVEIKSVTRSNARSDTKTNTATGVEGTDTSEVSKDVTISSGTRLKSVEIRESYYDETSRIYYSLAVMDKMRVQTSYKLELEKNKQKIEALKNKFRKSPSTNTYSEIEEVLAGFDSLSREYTVVSMIPENRPVSPKEEEQMKAMAETYASKNLVEVEYVDGDSDFHSLVLSCLADKKIQVVSPGKDDGMQSKYKIRYSLKEEQDDAFNVPGWVKINFVISGDVKNGEVAKKTTAFRSENGRSRNACYGKVKGPLSREICNKILAAVGG